MSKKNNTQKNTATVNTTTNTQNKEEKTMKNLATMSYRELQIFATTNNIPVKKSGKGITKDVLRKSIEDYLAINTETANVETPAPEQVVEEPVVEKTINHTEEKIKTILEETADVDVDKEENIMNITTINPSIITPITMTTDSWRSMHSPENAEDSLALPVVISDIMDGEYRPIDLAEKVYTAIWECLPDRGRTLMDGLTILTLGTVYAVEDFVDFAHEKVVPKVITLAKDTAEGITQWWRAEGKPFAEDVIDEVSADAEAFAETIIIPTAKKVGRNIINGAKRFSRGLKKGWAMRSDLINEYKEVA